MQLLREQQPERRQHLNGIYEGSRPSGHDTEQRRAIVVGGAGGIGSNVCGRLGVLGYRVVVADVQVGRAAEVAAQLQGKGHTSLALDITSAESVGAAFAAVEASGPAAVLVVASGGPVLHLGQAANVATVGQAVWDRTLALNLTGPLICLQAFARLRLAAPLDDARIILIGSAAGELAGNGTDAAYGVAKTALIGLTRQAALDLASAGITVNNVAPGPVGTPEFFRNTDAEIRSGISALTPLRRLATPEEVSAGVAYLASRDAGFVTGTTLAINGGLHMH